MVHRIVVEDQSLRWYGRPPKIADDSIEFVRFQFHLPEDWDPLVLVAQFTQADTYNVLLDRDTCFLPKELTAGICQVSLFGYSEGKPVRATSIPLVFQIEESGFVSSAETPIPPTPDLYAQLIEYFSSIAGSGGGGSGSGTINPEDIAAAVEDYLSKNPPEVPDLSDEVERAETAAQRAESANSSAQAALSGAAGAASDASNYAQQAQGFSGSASGSAGFANTRANAADAAAAKAEEAASDAEAAADRAEEAAKVTTDLDTTLTQKGKAADAKAVGDAISKLSGGNVDQSGLSATASALLIGILKNAVYTADQSANITALEVELATGGGSGSGGSGGGEASAYTVVCTIGDATIDNNASAVAAGASYTATITPNMGYELDTVTVLMGGVDVTATVYVDGVINIESVTGNVIIKVTTVKASDILYQLSEPTTFDGTNAIDTKVALLDEDKDWSIVVDLSIASPMSFISESYIYRIHNTEANNTLLGLSCYNNGCKYVLNENSVTISDKVWVGEKAGNTHKGVITHTAGTTVAVVNCYQTNIKGKVETATDKEIIASSYPQNDNTIMLCLIGGGGVVNVNDFKIYNRVLTDDEITAYLGV